MGRKPNPYLIDEDAPELTDEELASMRPARDVLPSTVFDSLVAAEPKRRRGQRGPGKRPAKVPVTLRLEPEIVANFRATGPGWQARISAIVREAASSRVEEGTGRKSTARTATAKKIKA